MANNRLKPAFLFVVFALGVSGCGGQSAVNSCTDKAALLWNRAITTNEYKGNERYWDAVTACQDAAG